MVSIEYSHRRTFLERTDPRARFLAFLILTFQILFVGGSQAIIGAAGAVLAATVLSPISLLGLLGKLLRVAWFVAIITLVNTFTLSGEVFVTVFGFYGTVEGLHEGLLLAARIALLLFASLLFAQTTRTADMTDALENMPSFFRKLLGSTTVVAGLTVNFVPLLIHSAQNIKRAQLARGVDADAGFLRQIRFAFSAALPLFVSALRSSHHLAEAMEARAYSPAAERTRFRTLTMHMRDWVMLLVLALELTAVLALSSRG